MKKETREVGTREVPVLGTVDFPVFTNLEEATAMYGEAVIFKMASRALNSELERVARDAFKASKPAQEVQVLVDNYRPGTTRAGKPTQKGFMEKLIALAGRGATDPKWFGVLVEAKAVYDAEGLEAACEFIDASQV